MSTQNLQRKAEGTPPSPQNAPFFPTLIPSKVFYLHFSFIANCIYAKESDGKATGICSRKAGEDIFFGIIANIQHNKSSKKKTSQTKTAGW